jgi:hypothetical protein
MVTTTTTPLKDSHGREVPVGSKGAIVIVHSTSPDELPAYEVEVLLFDKHGEHNDSHVFQARHDQLRLAERE